MPSAAASLVPRRARVVLADANVLYARVLRDYLLIAAEHELVEAHWSEQVLDDVLEHLILNRPTFDAAAATRLKRAMTGAFPDALVVPRSADYARLARFTLPDEDDRDVIAAALAVEATIICTNNVKHFPSNVMSELGLTVMTPDALFLRLIGDYLPVMVDVHRDAVKSLKGATDRSTLAALRRAGAPKTATVMSVMLKV
ncbi:MAG: PIN domain-containing protein [Bifidobacteriaceae bacterium]|nr:PIN domain-containing protein [Bifidobacteriaceae bacterium]